MFTPLTFSLTLITVTLLIIYCAGNVRKKRIAALKRYYEELLQRTDKRAALDAGRAYYAALRGNHTLTVYDEQAITNDLSTMP